jgi:hypothetical protein
MQVHGKCKMQHTEVLLAVLSWILQPSKLATPQTATPPPCEPRERSQAPYILHIYIGALWRNCLGRFEKQALTPCQARFMSTRAAQQPHSQFQFEGAM